MTSGTKRHFRGGNSTRTAVTAEQKERVLQRLRAGETPTAIAQAEGLPRTVILRISRFL